MKNAKWVFLVLMICTGCDREPIRNLTIEELQGEYTGTFERDGKQANVELQFNHGEFTGSSEVQKFPAICKGDFTIKRRAIVFNNTCPWTAEFDWSLILSGEWLYHWDGKNLTLTANGDKYNLIKN